MWCSAGTTSMLSSGTSRPNKLTQVWINNQAAQHWWDWWHRLTAESAEGRGESRVEFYLLEICTHSFLCIFINTENILCCFTAKQSTGEQLCPGCRACSQGGDCQLCLQQKGQAQIRAAQPGGQRESFCC